MYSFNPGERVSSAKFNSNFEELETAISVLDSRADASETVLTATLSSTFTSTTSIAFQDTGLKITLPDAGTYMFHCDLRASNGSSLNDYVTVRLYNQTTSTAVTDTERIGMYPTASNQVTVPLNWPVTTVSANTIIRVEIRPATARACQLLTNSDGKSVIVATRIS